MITDDKESDEVRQLATLHEVFRHATSQEPKWIPEDVVIQDEYTRDVIFRVREGLFLVMDTNLLGGIVGVSSWGHRPSEEELLKSRLDRGWSPTTSQFRQGPVILGYAARTIHSTA